MDTLLMDALDLRIYDGEGKLVTEIKHNVKSVLHLGSRKFGINNALLNLEMLKSLGVEDQAKNELSDFEKALNNKTVIKFGKRISNKPYKIIANGIMYCPDTNKVSHKFNLVIHEANISRKSEVGMNFETGILYQPSYIFDLFETESGDYVDLILEEV